jgi:hypothetical protein
VGKRLPSRNPRKSLAHRSRVERAQLISREYLFDLLEGKPVPARSVAMLAGEIAPSLLLGWEARVAKACPFDLSHHDLALVQRTAEQYCWDRASLIKGITWNELRSPLKRIARAARDICAALDEGPMAETWRRIEEASVGWRDTRPFARDML